MYRDDNLPRKLKTPGLLYILLCNLTTIFFALNVLYIEPGTSAVVSTISITGTKTNIKRNKLAKTFQ